MKYLITAIDWIKTNIDRLQAIGMIVVVVLLLSAFVKGGCQRRDLIDLTEKVTTIRVTNTQLLKNIEEKDNKLVLSDEEILRLQGKNAILVSDNDALKAKEGVLEDALATISDSLTHVTPNESYAFLQAVYPYEGILEYSFNEKQVKGIHLTYIEHRTLESLTHNLRYQIDNCAIRLAVQDTVSQELRGQVEIYESKEGDYKEIIVNKSTENSLLLKQVKKEKRRVVFYKITTGVAAGLAILIAL